MSFFYKSILLFIHVFPYFFNKFRFKEIYFSTYIKKALIITPKYIKCGRNVYIGHQARIEGISQYNEVLYQPIIILEDGVSIQQNVHLTCANQITIGKNTAIAANVTITDIHHPYTDPDIPIEKQDIKVKSVSIGKDCKIYNNSVILPGVHIGNHVTVGANSIVNKDIPDYSVAVGIPAKIVKSYNFEKQCWETQD